MKTLIDAHHRCMILVCGESGPLKEAAVKHKRKLTLVTVYGALSMEVLVKWCDALCIFQIPFRPIFSSFTCVLLKPFDPVCFILKSQLWHNQLSVFTVHCPFIGSKRISKYLVTF